MTKTSTPLYLGIDTGGTFTDGILLDPQTRRVIKKVKVLTTHQDLRECVSEVLEKLAPDDPSVISLVSLSTTLATNAIAEGKRQPAALFLLGYDPDLVYQFEFHKQFGTDRYFFIQGKHNLNGVEQIPLDEAEIKRVAGLVKEGVNALAVCSYSGPMNSTHEECAAEILAEMTGLPVVQAHHLSGELDSIRRATTASLNASLLSNVQELLDAVQASVAKNGFHCPVMLVRGDSSIVRAEFARKRPVEIIHSGPATSALGGQFLAGVENALVIDMGGTTTDLTLVERGVIRAQDQSATVGTYRTCVKTIQARSFGLGGDSLIRFDHWQHLSLGPERVIPISRACHMYSALRQDFMMRLRQKGNILYSDRFEYWVLNREPSREIEDSRTKQVIQLLRAGPQFLHDLLKEVGVYAPFQIDADDLVNQGIINRVGLTPTDLLHISGEYSPWDRESAWAMTKAAAKIWGESPQAFVQRVKDLITSRIVAEIIQYLTGKSIAETTNPYKPLGLDRWLFEESLKRSDPYLGCQLSLKVPIVGIGAPASVFLPPVAEALGTEIVIPDHFEVANAVGTVTGNIVFRQEGEVLPCVEGTSITGYFARAANSQRKFEQLGEALHFARETLEGFVRSEAQAAGAGAIQVEQEEREIIPGMYHLSAWAFGRPG